MSPVRALDKPVFFVFRALVLNFLAELVDSFSHFLAQYAASLSLLGFLDSWDIRTTG